MPRGAGPPAQALQAPCELLSSDFVNATAQGSSLHVLRWQNIAGLPEAQDSQEELRLQKAAELLTGTRQGASFRSATRVGHRLVPGSLQAHNVCIYSAVSLRIMRCDASQSRETNEPLPVA